MLDQQILEFSKSENEAFKRVEESMDKSTESFANVWASISLQNDDQIVNSLTYADLHNFIHEQLHRQNEAATHKVKK